MNPVVTKRIAQTPLAVSEDRVIVDEHEFSFFCQEPQLRVEASDPVRRRAYIRSPRKCLCRRNACQHHFDVINLCKVDHRSNVAEEILVAYRAGVLRYIVGAN